MAKKPISMSLPSDGSIDKVERGKIELSKGLGCKGLRLKMVIPLANSSGGSITMSDAQKQLVLANFLATLTWGPNGKRMPYVANDLRVIQRACRTLYGTEFEGYTDTSTGMGRALPNSATTNVTVYVVVPLGFFWKLRKPALLAFGRSQTKSVQLEMRRLGTVVIVSGLVISGTVSIDVMPDEVPMKFDQVSPGIEYSENDETDKKAKLPEGMPLIVEERTAVHASSTLSNISVKIDDLDVHDQVSPAELITEANDVPNYPAEAATTDRVTHLYVINGQGGSVELKDLPTGTPQVVQNVKDLATIKLSQFSIPILPLEEINSMLEHAAGKQGRGKKLRAVSTNLLYKLGLGSNAAFAAPFALVDEDDDEFERYPGQIAAVGQKADVAVPSSVLNEAKRRYAIHKGANEHKAAENVLAELTATIPGAVQSARGFKRGDVSMLERVKREIA